MRCNVTASVCHTAEPKPPDASSSLSRVILPGDAGISNAAGTLAGQNQEPLDSPAGRLKTEAEVNYTQIVDSVS